MSFPAIQRTFQNSGKHRYYWAIANITVAFQRIPLERQITTATGHVFRSFPAFQLSTPTGDNYWIASPKGVDVILDNEVIHG